MSSSNEVCFSLIVIVPYVSLEVCNCNLSSSHNLLESSIMESTCSEWGNSEKLPNTLPKQQMYAL